MFRQRQRQSASPYFDVREPIPGGLETIQGLLGGYATPQAADADFSPASGGRKYLTDEYQRLTGDAFADPFQDNIRGGHEAALDMVRRGASMGVGSNTGPHVLSPPPRPTLAPVPSATGEADSRNAVVNAVTAAASGAGGAGAGLAEGAGASMLPTIRGGNRVAALQKILGPQEPTPAQSRASVLDTPRYSLALAGSDEKSRLDRITERVDVLNNPMARKLWEFMQQRGTGTGSFNPSINPLIQGQAIRDAKGKPIAGNQIEKSLLHDPQFAYFVEHDRPGANDFYRAVYNRDMESDLKSQRELETAQGEARGRAEASIKDPVFDEKTGVLMERVYTKTPAGETKMELRPLNAFQRESRRVDREKGINRYGIPDREETIPNGLYPEEREKFIALRDTFIDGGMAPWDAYVKANDQLEAEQRARNVSPTSSHDEVSSIYAKYKAGKIKPAEAMLRLRGISDPRNDRLPEDRWWVGQAFDATRTTAAQLANQGIDRTNSLFADGAFAGDIDLEDMPARRLPYFQVPKGGYNMFR